MSSRCHSRGLASMDRVKGSNELRNLVIDMKEESDTLKRRTRSSSRSLPTPSLPQISRKRTRSRKSSTPIKQEIPMEIKHELIKYGNEANNNIQRLRKKKRQNPIEMINLTGPDAPQVKIEKQSVNSNHSETDNSSAFESTPLNIAFLDHTITSGNGTIAFEKPVSLDFSQTENGFIDDSEIFDSNDVENMIKLHVINVDEPENSPKSMIIDKTVEDETLAETPNQTELSEDIVQETKMKCLSDVISEVFDCKLPESEERMYFSMQHVLDEYKYEADKIDLKREAARKNYEKECLAHIQAIKSMLKKMNKRKLMVDEATQTEDLIEKAPQVPEISSKIHEPSVDSSPTFSNVPEVYGQVPKVTFKVPEIPLPVPKKSRKDSETHSKASKGSASSRTMLEASPEFPRITKHSPLPQKTSKPMANLSNPPVKLSKPPFKITTPYESLIRNANLSLNIPATSNLIKNTSDGHNVPEDSPKKKVTFNKDYQQGAKASEDILDDNDCQSDVITGMIVLDSLESSAEHPSSVFQRLGHRRSGRSKTAHPVDQMEKFLESLETLENPSPPPLTYLELQREVIERQRREANIVMTGLQGPNGRSEADVSEFIWQYLGIRAGVVNVMKIGQSLVVTVGSQRIKMEIMKRRRVFSRCGVKILSDYTGRERKVQNWLEMEEKKRRKAGEDATAAYGKLIVGSVCWYWHELEGTLTRTPFRPELVLGNKSPSGRDVRYK